jgi:hypothetical protein
MISIIRTLDMEIIEAEELDSINKMIVFLISSETLVSYFEAKSRINRSKLTL